MNDPKESQKPEKVIQGIANDNKQKMKEIRQFDQYSVMQKPEDAENSP